MEGRCYPISQAVDNLGYVYLHGNLQNDFALVARPIGGPVRVQMNQPHNGVKQRVAKVKIVETNIACCTMGTNGWKEVGNKNGRSQ